MSDTVFLSAAYAVGFALWAYLVYKGDLRFEPKWVVWAAGAIWPVSAIILTGALIKQKLSS